jgi:elongation factor Ts
LRYADFAGVQVASKQTSMTPVLALVGGALCAFAFSQAYSNPEVSTLAVVGRRERRQRCPVEEAHIEHEEGCTCWGCRTSPITMAAATIDAKEVKKLRDATGAGMMDCKTALVDANGDYDVAMEALRKKGLASADKKASRATSEGVIETYIHTGSKLGVMVELNCETDFVAKLPDFKEVAKTIAMQVAATPTAEVVRADEIPAEFIEKETKMESQAEDLKGKPAEIIDKIVSGRVQKLMKTKILMEQPYIRDPNQTVEDFVKSNTAKFGENIKIARFIRFNLGELQVEKKDADAA